MGPAPTSLVRTAAAGAIVLARVLGFNTSSTSCQHPTRGAGPRVRRSRRCSRGGGWGGVGGCWRGGRTPNGRYLARKAGVEVLPAHVELHEADEALERVRLRVLCGRLDDLGERLGATALRKRACIVLVLRVLGCVRLRPRLDERTCRDVVRVRGGGIHGEPWGPVRSFRGCRPYREELCELEGATLARIVVGRAQVGDRGVDGRDDRRVLRQGACARGSPRG